MGLIFTIIFIVVTIVLLIISFSNNPDKWFSNVLASLFGSAIVSSVLSVLIIAFGKAQLETEERVRSSYNLVALDTDKETVGSHSSIFFVGSGYIGEEMYYHFFYETSNGVKYDKIRANGKVYIVETNDTPKVVKYYKYYKDKESIFYDSEPRGHIKTVLYIPKGTIKNNYKVN